MTDARLARARRVMKARRERTSAQGLCARCGCRPAVAPGKRCQRCIDYMIEYRERKKDERNRKHDGQGPSKM